MDFRKGGFDVGVGSGGRMRMQAIRSIKVIKTALNSVVFLYPTRENRLFSRMGWIKVPSEEPAATKVIAKVRFFLK
jgi:hypothetical protein